jgi:hypothetical protein
MPVEADSVWGAFAAASVAVICRAYLVSQPNGGEKEERGNSAMSGAAGRPAEVLREGSGIRVDGTASDGLTISTYIKDVGNLL